MKQDVKLYIDNRLVEFTKPFEIFYNFQLTELEKPTIIKNKYTRNIELDDTQINNEIFGNIWNVEKIVDAGGNVAGSSFNPNKKVPFTLYVNSDIFEKGYVKLNKIKKQNNRYKYDITLFGGMGDMFYELSNKQLSDLEYKDNKGNVKDLSFTINKETVFDAWNTVIGNINGVYDEANVIRPLSYVYNSKWDIVNFMPAYEGIPSNNFSADKVLINAKDFNITKSSNGYTTINGFALGTTSEDLTMNETGDMRSYLQRPVIRMKSIINACQNPVNNGGWEVKLDDYFFNDKNPYYNDTWMTLNKLVDNEKKENTSEILNGASLVKNEKDYDVVFDDIDLRNYNNAQVDIQVDFNLTSTNYATTPNYLYTQFDYHFNKTKKNKKPEYYDYRYNGALCIQLVAYDENNKIISASDTLYLSNKGSGWFSSLFENGRMTWEKDGIPTNEVKYHYGFFKRSGNTTKYNWVNNDGSNTFTFTFVNEINFYKLKLRQMWLSETYTKKKYSWAGTEEGTGGSTQSKTNDTIKLWANTVVTNETNSDNELNVINRLGGKTEGKNELVLVNASVVRTVYNNFFSGTKINVEDYLNTGINVADYLIGYAKMFGLYFWTDASEISSNSYLYPKGVMHILTRDNFFKLNNIEDLTDVVDRGREYEITPYIFDKKYYTFDVPQVDSEVADEYKKKYGAEYGIKQYLTGFEFNDETKNLIDKTPFQSGIDTLEVDKYFTQRSENNLPAYYYNGFSYELYRKATNDLQTTTIDIPVEKKELNDINDSGIKFGDSFPKLQFHSTQNDSISDANNVLVFFNGSSLVDEVNNYYYLTDDIAEMFGLNDETPCYILTNSNTNSLGDKIAYKLIELPKFGRTKVSVTGNIEYSLDMGKTKMTYVKGNYLTENCTITNNVWDDYINDLKNENNKKMKCYINFNHLPNAYLLRNLYWYENNFWVLNSAKNWNINLIQPVECELVKVIDRNNYKTDKIEYEPYIVFKLEGLTPYKVVENKDVNITDYYYNISKDLTKLNVVIYSQDNLFEWHFGDYFYRRDFETGRTEEEPFSYYTTAEQYNVGSMKPDIRLPKSEYKQIYDIPIFTESGYRYIAHLETDGKIS